METRCLMKEPSGDAMGRSSLGGGSSLGLVDSPLSWRGVEEESGDLADDKLRDEIDRERVYESVTPILLL
ncbi:hypothetical protein Tco_1017060 [Tanacetum coccineum]|uniref:Uncharacterized protein n=1 Tax=Tanacetum coccineum TaxID=301880 RepID=A0ABQ5FRM1_9ASTR